MVYPPWPAVSSRTLRLRAGRGVKDGPSRSACGLDLSTASPPTCSSHVTAPSGLTGPVRSCVAFLEGACLELWPASLLAGPQKLTLQGSGAWGGGRQGPRPALTPTMASRVFLSTSCLPSIRRSLKDSRRWSGRFREEPWPSWQSFSATGSTWPMSVSCLPSRGGGAGWGRSATGSPCLLGGLLPRHKTPGS